MSNRSLKEWLLEAWDIAFILLLCFLVLIATMFAGKMQAATVTTSYHFGAASLGLVFGLLGIYLIFILIKQATTSGNRISDL